MSSKKREQATQGPPFKKGYQPEGSTLEESNPPTGGTGVPEPVESPDGVSAEESEEPDHGDQAP